MSCMYKFPLLSLQSNVIHFFHPVMVTTQMVVLTGHSAIAFNLIFEISAVVLVINNQQTKTGDVLIIFWHIHVAGCSGQAVHITYSECVCVCVCVCVCILAIVIQYAKCMCHIILSSVTSLAAPYFFHIISYMVRFLEKVTQHKMCILIFSTPSI